MTVMKIGYDGSDAALNLSQAGTCSRYLLEKLSEFYPGGYRFTLFVPKRKDKGLLKTLQKRKSVTVVYPKGFFRFAGNIWRNYFINSEIEHSKIDIYHALCGRLPFRIENTGVKTIVSIPELGFLLYPQYYSALRRRLEYRRIEYACRHADMLIVPTRTIANALMKYFQVKQRRIAILAPPCPQIFKLTASDRKKKQIKQHYQLPERYILVTGGVCRRKNLATLVAAMAALPSDLHLVIAGNSASKERWKLKAQASRAGAGNRLTFIPEVPGADLPSLYQMAAIYAEPQEYEGYSLYLAQALASGTPAVAAGNSALNEAGGDDSLYVEAGNSTRWSEAINSLLNDAELRRRVTEKGRRFQKRFSERKYADIVIQLYKTVINKHF